jgi:hypothetical protein
MAVVASLMPHQGQYFCLVLDDESDSIEVVFPSGFEHDVETGDIEFAAAYFVDALAGPGLPFREVTIRMDEATDAPAGLMVERVSSYGHESVFALVPALVRLAYRTFEHRSGGTPELFPSAEPGPLRVVNGNYHLVNA